MPELPEVETIKETLKKQVLNKVIEDVIINYPKIIEYPNSLEFKNKIINQKINDIKRRGKWLMFELDNYYLLSHLRMEGKYFIKNNSDEHSKHEHVIFKLDDKKELRYLDTRKFGRMYLYTKEEAYQRKPLNELGLEPWNNDLNNNYLKNKYKNKKLPIKTVLLDQTIIVGIGNIYADEILYLSKINPLKKANRLTKKELDNIIKYTKEVLEHAIKMGGTTIRSYQSSEGVHGTFQEELLVHNHAGDICNICKSTIKKIQIGGRSTYYCPKCQK